MVKPRQQMEMGKMLQKKLIISQTTTTTLGRRWQLIGNLTYSLCFTFTSTKTKLYGQSNHVRFKLVKRTGLTQCINRHLYLMPNCVLNKFTSKKFDDKNIKNLI